MEYDGLISAAANLVSGAARGAADSIGAGAGQVVSDLVRARLGTTEEGRAALAGVDADPAATDGLHAALRDALAADPDFADRLAEALAGTPPTAPAPEVRNSVVIGGRSKVRNSTISLGPVTLNNTRTTRLSLGLGALVLAVLLTLATYGGVQIIVSDASPESAGPLPEAGAESTPETSEAPGSAHPVPPAGDGEETPGNAVVEDAHTALRILPDLGALPPGWSQPEANSVMDAADRAPEEVPEGLRYVAFASFESASTTAGRGPEGALIQVYAYAGVETASSDFSELRDLLAETGGPYEPVSLPATGDESAAYTHLEQGVRVVTIAARVGSVLCEVTLPDKYPGYQEDAVAFTHLVVARAEQALNGQVPSASLS